MGQATAISWTDHTFNPWWGCTKLAHPQGSGCDNCYAATFARRTGNDVWGHDADRRLFGDKHWAEPLHWNRDAEAAGTPAFVFCASMGDVFEDRRDLDEPRARLWALIESTPWLTWLLLTKRPEQMCRLAPDRWADGWPVNVWAGTTVCHQADAALRVPRLLAVPASRRFLSGEPLLGPVDLLAWLTPYAYTGALLGLPGQEAPADYVDWVIIGGESGGGRRELDLAHLEDLAHQCNVAEVPVWVKQDSGTHPGRQGRIPDHLWIHRRPPAKVP